MSSVFPGLNSLALLFFDFVAAEIFLGFRKHHVFPKHRVVFFERQFVRSVHGVFLGIISSHARFFRDETNQFSLSVILLCHNSLNYITDTI